MPSNNNFKKSYELGLKYEAMLPDYIEECYDEYVKAPNKQFPDWDAKFRRGETWTHYEVKADLSAHKTGNLFIEYRHTNKPSGISLTKSDYYMFFIVDGDNDKLIDVIEIPTEILKEKCNSGCYRTAVCWNSGFNKSEGYIIPISEFLLE
jgi:hypothetical protein